MHKRKRKIVKLEEKTNKMKTLPSLLIILLFIVGCTSQKETAEVKSANKKSDVNEMVISFEQTACFGSCPVHKMVIFERANATYHGDRNVKFEGDFIGSFSPKKMKEIIAKANAINFFDLEAEYTAPMTDLPTTIIYIRDGNKKHQVTAYAEYPKELGDFIAYLYEVSQNVNWSKNM